MPPTFFEQMAAAEQGLFCGDDAYRGALTVGKDGAGFLRSD